MTSQPLVYPLGSLVGDLQHREQGQAKREAAARVLAERIWAGEDISPPPAKPKHVGLISDFGYHPRPTTNDTRGLDYDSDAERKERVRRQQREAANRRRALMAGATIVRTVNRAAIIARDKSICHICDQLCNDNEIHLDHVIPLALGGQHCAENIRVSHASCNLTTLPYPDDEEEPTLGVGRDDAKKIAAKEAKAKDESKSSTTTSSKKS